MLTEQIKEELERLPRHTITLLLLPASHYQKATIAVARYWLETSPKTTGIYVSLNQSYQNLLNILRKGKVDHNRLFLIDCVTRPVVGVPNCQFLKDQNPADLGAVISLILQKHRPAFFVLDSVNALVPFYQKEQVFPFVHFLVRKLRSFEGSILLAIADGPNRTLVTELSALCDHVINISTERERENI